MFLEYLFWTHMKLGSCEAMSCLCKQAVKTVRATLHCLT